METVNFTHKRALSNAIISSPRQHLFVEWDNLAGLLVCTTIKVGKMKFPKPADPKFNVLNMAGLIRISAQRGGAYAR